MDRLSISHQRSGITGGLGRKPEVTHPHQGLYQLQIPRETGCPFCNILIFVNKVMSLVLLTFLSKVDFPKESVLFLLWLLLPPAPPIIRGGRCPG